MSSFFKKNKVSKPNCPSCGLDTQCKSPRMKYSGEGQKGILIISEFPSNEDDRAGKQLVGSAGRMLQQELRLLNINLEKDCWKVNAVHCRTPMSKKGVPIDPTPKQVQNCRPYAEWVIKQLKPSKIILLGPIALESFYGERNRKCIGMTKMAGLKLWDSDYNAWVFPLWHPEFLQQKKHDALLKAEFKRKLNDAIKADPTPLNKQWNPTHTLITFKQAKKALRNCLKLETLIAVDFETTGLDMYKKGHKTLSFGWATDKGAWAVPVQHPYWNDKQAKKIYKLVQKILNSEKIKKIVQGINFEYPWTKQQMKVEPKNFSWDTQLATHILDNRTGITPLKFQVYARWGIGDYDSLSKKFIKSTDTGFNNMIRMPVDALLTYNAYDALYTYELYKEQLSEFTESELQAYNFMHDGSIVMCEMSYNGISIKEEYYLRQKKNLEEERDVLIAGIGKSDEVKLYIRKYGGVFDYNSPKDLQRMLFKVLKLKPVKETKTGFSVDEEVLTKIDIKLTKDIIAVRKLNKMIGTYVDGFLKHTHDKMMHPSFSLSRARSFRSSSQSPNFHNVPKRDPKAKRITRSGMVPRKGRVLGEMDFEGAEISTSCYYHKDPTFIEYQTDGGGDMHKDAAAEILKVSRDYIPKQARQATKGIWTFSQFYGSYYVSCAKQGYEEYPLVVDKEGELVEINGVPIDQHMKNKFPTYKSFENHLKKFENKFWKEWFPVYTQWKDDITLEYKKIGYVETFLGFRFKGYMNKKQCTNYPIQGTSFHLLVYTIVKFWEELKERKLKTLIIGQIHDSIILDIPIDEIDEVKHILAKIVYNLHNTFKWMDFPMGLDLEISKSYEQGGSFADMEKLAI